MEYITNAVLKPVNRILYGYQDVKGEDTQSLTLLQNPICIANCEREVNGDILASWNYERCEVYKTEQMLEMGISKEFAGEADCFILYHRKA